MEQRTWNTLADGRDIRDYISDAFQEHSKHLQRNPKYSIPFQDEHLLWVIQEWHGMMGEFTEAEYTYLCNQWKLTPTEVQDLVYDSEDKNNPDNEFNYQCEACEHMETCCGFCKLQDVNYCMNVCQSWTDVYRTCPLKKVKK